MLKMILLFLTWHMMKNEFSTLVILIFNYFFHHSYKKLNSIIELGGATKYASRMEHTKIILIIGVREC